ncbi:MAG: efflux RND transporter periplasmic adaptor subunit [Candidatus Symbiothrix sp.]|jgi:multidrug efflux pump subunit AcrA (membrane-fusion protein)|nr:efflux RND transporter periplasmic adaptor subunit [Candidatus Symbiothrix sp.]
MKQKIRIGYLLPALLFLFACGKEKTLETPVGAVKKGDFYIEVYEEGEIEAMQSTTIFSPSISWRYGNLKISQIVKDGAEVNAGDTLIVFDPADVQRNITESENRVEISLAELERMKAQHASDLEELRADYQVTKISQEISKIRYEAAVYESDMSKKTIRLNLEKADNALLQAEEQIENRIKIQKEEIKQKNLDIAQDRARLKEAYETLNKLSVISPSPGIAIINKNWSTGNKFTVGDQSWSNSALIQLPDLSKLKATVSINEVDIAKISKGLQVEIKPDAFSDSVFTGEVMTIANLAVNKEGSTKIKVFPVEILIHETNPNLLPGLTVSCRIIIDKLTDVLYVPLEALHSEGDRQFVYKKTGGSFDKTEVETGAVNADYAVIVKGLDEKDKVALANPFQTDDKNANKLKDSK